MFFNFDIDFDNIQRRSLPFSTVTLQESINTFKKWHLNKLSPFEKLIVSVKQVLMVGMVCLANILKTACRGRPLYM